MAYAFYIKAISLYEQIVDIGRDQSNTEGALVALQDVVQRFPDTEYARDATLKIDLTNDLEFEATICDERPYFFEEPLDCCAVGIGALPDE